jgi:MFS family permease
MSAIVVQEQYLTYFNSPAGVIQGAIGSALAAGSVVGSAVAGPLSDKYGRRDSVSFHALIYVFHTRSRLASTTSEILKALYYPESSIHSLGLQ